MKTGFERYIALRYLRGAHGGVAGRKFLRFVTYIAIGGVSVGVCALILALSIVRGFSHEIEAKIIGFGAHVQVENFRDAPLSDGPRLRQLLDERTDIEHISTVVQEFILLRRSSRKIDGVSIWGTEALPPYLEGALVAGSADLKQDESGHFGMIVGSRLAQDMDIEVGDRVTAFSIRGRSGIGQSAMRPPRVKQFRVTGVFETSLANFDELYVFTSVEPARNLLSYRDDQITRYDITVAADQDVREVAASIDESLEFPVMARSIYDVYRSLFAWVGLQESIIPLIIGIIVLVAAFNMIGTLLMIILEKTGEVGILSSMGASPKTLKKIFLYLGLYIGGAGIFIGEAISLALAWAQLEFSLIPLPKEAYYMNTAPIELVLTDFVLVAVLTLILCAVSAYIPARFAAKIEPIRAIHLR